jgi:hypothetical protein
MDPYYLIPVHLIWSQGWFVCLLYLCAVTSFENGYLLKLNCVGLNVMSTCCSFLRRECYGKQFVFLITYTLRHCTHVEFLFSDTFIEHSLIGDKYNNNKKLYITYIPLTLYPRRDSRGISDIPPRRLRFIKFILLQVILQTWQVAHRRLIAVYLRCKCY